MASDWLAAVLPANQMPDSKIVLTKMNFQHGYLLVTQAPEGAFSRYLPFHELFVIPNILQLCGYWFMVHLYAVLNINQLK